MNIGMDEQAPVPGEVPPESEQLPLAPPAPAPPMGWKFWAVMGLIALLVGLIVYYQVEIAARPVPSGLAGTSWTLAYYTIGNGTLVPATGATTATLDFDSGNATGLSGQSGCNRYSYKYTIHASSFSLDPGSGTITKMNCPEPGVMQFESAYLGNLGNATSVTARNDRLYMYGRDKTLLLIFATESP